MTKFDVGDRVRYTGAHPSLHDRSMVGQLGSVVNNPASIRNIRVRWDNGGTASHYPENLQNLTKEKAFAESLRTVATVADAFRDMAKAAEPKAQTTLRKTADEAEQQARALQSLASATRRLADAMDRVEEFSK